VIIIENVQRLLSYFKSVAFLLRHIDIGFCPQAQPHAAGRETFLSFPTSSRFRRLVLSASFVDRLRWNDPIFLFHLKRKWVCMKNLRKKNRVNRQYHGKAFKVTLDMTYLMMAQCCWRSDSTTLSLHLTPYTPVKTQHIQRAALVGDYSTYCDATSKNIIKHTVAVDLWFFGNRLDTISTAEFGQSRL